jgi:aminoglycoside phosphotransferase (APT) family kinase protein
LIHVLDFNDGIKWVLRLPLKDPGSRRLQSEIMTMHFIRKYTTIPIPDIISFDSTTENEIASPYTIMQFNDGTPVCQIWWDESGPTPLEERRHRILDTVASAMSQLTQFKFNKIGCLEFEGDTRSHLVSSPKIGPLNIEQEEEIRQQEAEHNGAIFKSVGPFDSSREYLTSLLDAQIIEDDSFAIGMNRLLRMMVESLPLSSSIVESLPLSRSIVESLPLSRSMTENESFVLTHPDFGGQNFLVAEDGTLTAIIDWDNVQTVPQWIGCRSYPAWLTRDWDPLMYGYPEAERENSPEELDAYRKYYAGRMASLGSAQFTTKSHIYEAIYNASSSPACADSIIDKIFHHLFPVEDNDDNYNPDTPDLGEVVEALAEESLEEHVENKVLSSIQELLSLPEETPTTTVTHHLSTGKKLWRFLRKWTGATLIFALSLIPKWSGILNFFRNARPRTDVSIGRRRV